MPVSKFGCLGLVVAMSALADQAEAQIYVEYQTGDAFDSRIKGLSAIENFNYPDPLVPELAFPSDVSTLELKNSSLIGLRLGYEFANGLGVELDTYFYKPSLKQQDVTITLREPILLDGVPFQEFSENQLGGRIRLWVINPTVKYGYQIGRFMPYVAGGPALVVNDVRADGTSCRFLDELEQFGEFVSECPAPFFEDVSVSFGWSAKLGATYKFNGGWRLGLEYKLNRFQTGTKSFRSLEAINGTIHGNLVVLTFGKSF